MNDGQVTKVENTSLKHDRSRLIHRKLLVSNLGIEISYAAHVITDCPLLPTEVNLLNLLCQFITQVLRNLVLEVLSVDPCYLLRHGVDHLPILIYGFLV